MAGIGYSIETGRLMTTFSVVAGPSFNRAELNDAFVQGLAPIAGPVAIDISNSLAIRPGVNLAYALAPRVGLVGFGGYLYNRPDVVLRAGETELHDRWKADAIVLSLGAVYSVWEE
jgi:hypothetical protein